MSNYICKHCNEAFVLHENDKCPICRTWANNTEIEKKLIQGEKEESVLRKNIEKRLVNVGKLYYIDCDNQSCPSIFKAITGCLHNFFNENILSKKEIVDYYESFFTKEKPNCILHKK